MSESARWYHGGVAGLEVGDLLLPPAETGVPSCADYPAAEFVCRRDRVYMTQLTGDARVYAALAFGDLYEVEPVGELEPDQDWAGGESGVSMCAPRARVVAVLERRVRLSAGRAEIQAWLAQPAPKPPRNAPCPCGSGVKAKRCGCASTGIAA